MYSNTELKLNRFHFTEDCGKPNLLYKSITFKVCGKMKLF